MDTGTTVGRFRSNQVVPSKHPTKRGRVKGQDAGSDAKECVPAQHFNVPVVEVECFMRNYGRGVDKRLVIGSICECGAGGGFVIRRICGREVG